MHFEPGIDGFSPSLRFRERGRSPEQRSAPRKQFALNPSGFPE
jgi:hypothetical protein